MSIVNSTYELLQVEPDGRRYVIERHYNQDWREFASVYLAEPGTDYGARLASTAAMLNEQLADEEIERLIDGA